MKLCRTCKYEYQTGRVTVTISFGGRTYTRLVRALVCAGCGDEEALIGHAELERAELQVARRIARNGEATPEAFKFMRSVLGYSGAELGALLGVSADTVSRWEREAHNLPRAAWLALVAMIEDKASGRDEISRIAEAAEHPHEEHGQIALEETVA